MRYKKKQNKLQAFVWINPIYASQSHQPKQMHMKDNPSLRSIIILAVLCAITYALIDGIRYGNILGIVLAVGSLGAFGISVLLINKLRKLKEMEDQEELDNEQ